MPFFRTNNCQWPPTVPLLNDTKVMNVPEPQNTYMYTSQVAECSPLAQSENCSSMSSFEYRDRHLSLSTRETLNISNSKMVFNYILSLIFSQQKFQLKIHHLCLLEDVCCVRIVSLSPSLEKIYYSSISHFA